MNKKNVLIVLGILAAFVVAGWYVNNEMQRAGVQTNQFSSSASSVVLGDYGKAPGFVGIDKWINSGPVTLADLKGKVVLVDFWTYSCINCIRTLPHVTSWYQKYKDKGLVVVGVHTPEFAFEKDSNNVKDAVARFNISYPVAQDNEYGTWNAYGNQYWPAEYLINQDGEIVYVHFAEGEYDKTENAIRDLLGLNANIQAGQGDNLNEIGSPEMYLGTDRLANLSSDQNPSPSGLYVLPPNLASNRFALSGDWSFSPQFVELARDTGSIRLKFHSGKLFMVAASERPATLKIVVDGKEQHGVVVTSAKLYTIFDSNDYSDHVVEITVTQSGFRGFTFTFG